VTGASATKRTDPEQAVADIFGIISAGYVKAGTTLPSKTPYVAVDPAAYQGTWTGKYANNQKFSLQVSNVTGFRAKVKYQSGSTVKYQDVLIKDQAFRIGDSKFTLTRPGVAQVKTVNISPVDGSTVLDTAYANQDSHAS
jgi:hypothetical protein